MRKCKIFVAVAMAAVILFGGVVFKIGASASEQVEKEIKEVDVKKFDKILPVITAISGHVYTRDSGYDAYRSTFYETSFNGILNYCEKNKLVDYTEDENNYYLDPINMNALSDIAYYGGDTAEIREVYDKGAMIYYDEELNVYVIAKEDVDMGYTVKLTKPCRIRIHRTHRA